MNYSGYIAPHTIEQGQEAINKLLYMLEHYTLDPVFEIYGDFYEMRPIMCNGELCREKHHFNGNFQDYSFVFNIYTDDESLANVLKAAINKHRASARYSMARENYYNPKKSSFLHPTIDIHRLRAWNSGENYDRPLFRENEAQS